MLRIRGLFMTRRLAEFSNNFTVSYRAGKINRALAQNRQKGGTTSDRGAFNVAGLARKLIAPVQR